MVMHLHYIWMHAIGAYPMNAILEADSTLTDRYQTTVPEPVRRALGLQKRDAIHYELRADGEVRISRAAERNADPAISSFLAFLESDIAAGRNVSPVSATLVAQIQQLVKGVEIDLEAPLDPEDE